MEQFRQVGEAIGSIKALMMFRDEIKINQRQCILLTDAFDAAFNSISDEIKQHLRFDEKLTKWKSIEHPLRELHRVFREGEFYIKTCLETKKEWWGRALSMTHSTECVEFHLHNLFWCVPVVVEAIEAAGEISGCDQEEIQKKRVIFSKKYERDWMDPKLFERKFGKLYLVSKEMSRRLDSASKEDRWVLSEAISEKRPLSRHENRIAELLVGPKGRLYSSSALTGSQDYQVRRRLGMTNCKEIQWMGESYAMKHVIGEMEPPLVSEITLLSSLAHPNVMNYMYAFADDEKKECFIVMELMSKDLSSYIKEVSSPRRRIPFPLLVAVDTMLQIARGMEYLHSKKIYHGDMNPSNVLVKARNSTSSDGYLQVKVANFGLSPIKNSKPVACANSCIWYAPEVLAEQEQMSSDSVPGSKYAEKADVYSFAMICFELLTGKVPFEESHLQGDKMARNIRAGERPLFPFSSPKYLVSLTKRCWQTDPMQRSSFSSICRMLRYIKRFLVMNPDHNQPDSPVPLVDCFDVEMSLLKRFSNWGEKAAPKVLEIPFQMYAYRVVERERTSVNLVKERSSDSGSEGASICGDENVFQEIAFEDSLSMSVGSMKSLLSHSSSEGRRGSIAKKVDGKANKQTGQNQKSRTARPSQRTLCGHSLRRKKSDSHLRPFVMSQGRRRTSGHASDSDL